MTFSSRLGQFMQLFWWLGLCKMTFDQVIKGTFNDFFHDTVFPPSQKQLLDHAVFPPSVCSPNAGPSLRYAS